MKDLDSAINRFLKDKKNPTSERAYYIQKICDEFFTNDDFNKILGQTKEFTPEEILAIFEKARSWKTNPPALFWKLVKEKQAEIKKNLADAEAASKES